MWWRKLGPTILDWATWQYLYLNGIFLILACTIQLSRSLACLMVWLTENYRRWQYGIPLVTQNKTFLGTGISDTAATVYKKSNSCAVTGSWVDLSVTSSAQHWHILSSCNYCAWHHKRMFIYQPCNLLLPASFVGSVNMKICLNDKVLGDVQWYFIIIFL